MIRWLCQVRWQDDDSARPLQVVVTGLCWQPLACDTACTAMDKRACFNDRIDLLYQKKTWTWNTFVNAAFSCTKVQKGNHFKLTFQTAQMQANKFDFRLRTTIRQFKNVFLILLILRSCLYCHCHPQMDVLQMSQWTSSRRPKTYHQLPTSSRTTGGLTTAAAFRTTGGVTTAASWNTRGVA